MQMRLQLEAVSHRQHNEHMRMVVALQQQHLMLSEKGGNLHKFVGNLQLQEHNFKQQLGAARIYKRQQDYRQRRFLAEEQVSHAGR